MLLEWTDKLTTTDITSILGVLTLSVFLILTFLPASTSWSKLPLVNDKLPSEVWYTNAAKRFQADAYSLIKAGFQKSTNAFRLVTDNGPRLVLSGKYVDDVRSDSRLSFGKFMALEFHSQVPGFDPFNEGASENPVFQDAVRMKLTQAIGHITEPLSEETTHALQVNWTDNPDWHELTLKPTILDIVARLSSKVFLGDDICRNPAWLRITVNYTVDSMIAARQLRLYPRAIRPIVAWFLPCCRKLREEIKEAREIITPVLEQKRARKAALIQEGKPVGRSSDAMEWMEESAHGRPYDPTIAQLTFSLAAVHTTTDMLTQVIYDLCEQPELAQALREEVIEVIQEDGWKKTALYKMKLMDSVLKESQRLKPTSIVSLRRMAMSKIQLPDGLEVPKGASIMVTCNQMWDSSVYPEGDKFDGYRFFNIRQIPGQETSSQLVATSPQHMGFGHGKHACPGRFFAANEMKIALCHMLLKYDFRAVDKAPPVMKAGVSLLANPKARVAIRRRREEIEL